MACCLHNEQQQGYRSKQQHRHGAKAAAAWHGHACRFESRPFCVRVCICVWGGGG
jgi:hypothetical protein